MLPVYYVEHSIMAQNPNVDSVTTTESMVVELHKRRRHFIDCLHFGAAESVKLRDAPRLYVRLETFLRQELVQMVRLDGKDASLACRVFKETESSGNLVSEASATEQSAPSSCELCFHSYLVLPLIYRCSV